MIRTRWMLGVLAGSLGAVSPIAAATYSGTVLADGPLGYYRMDDTSGATALDIAGTVQNGNYRNGATATANPPTAGAPLLSQSGPQSPAFPGFESTNTGVQFDGVNNPIVFDAANTDNLQITTLTFSDLVNYTYTYEAWVFNTRPIAERAVAGYIGGRGTVEANQDSIAILGTAISPGNLLLYNGTQTLVGPTEVTTNAWHHVAYTRTGTTVAFYLDGALQASSSAFANNLAGGGANHKNVYGGMRSDGTLAFQGKIDELAVYDNKVLSASQIQAHYNAAFSTGLFALNNASFELQNVDVAAPTDNQTGTGDGARSLQLIQGWSGNQGTYGVFDPTNAEYAGTAADGNPVSGGDGDQIGFITSTGLITAVSHTVPDLIQAGTYDFTLAIGSRLNAASAGYNLQMLVGGTSVASEVNAITLPIGSLTDRTVSFGVPLGSPLIGQLLTLRISNTIGSGTTDFDIARLTFTPIPEPGTLVTMMMGGIIFIFSRRIRPAKM